MYKEASNIFIYFDRTRILYGSVLFQSGIVVILHLKKYIVLHVHTFLVKDNFSLWLQYTAYRFTICLYYHFMASFGVSDVSILVWGNYGGTEMTFVRFYLSRAHDILSRAHDIISQSGYTKYIHEWKLTDSRNNYILSYCNAKCQYFRTQVYIHCWISCTSFDTFSQSFLFTLVNNSTSIVNTPFFSRRHLIRRKVAN